MAKIDSVQEESCRRAGIYLSTKRNRRFSLWANIGVILATIALVGFVSYVLVVVCQ